MSKKEYQYPIGVIHGRFQILHNDHMKYLLAGKEFCRHLVIGITNPDPFLTKNHVSNPHRSLPLNNPLTYYERMVMITEAFIEQGLQLSEFSIVPFPINVPELIKHYVPMDAIFFLSIYDNWGRQKKKYLESLGLNVHVLWEVPLAKKGLSGSEIRKDMIMGNAWEKHVPNAVMKLIQKWKIIERLRKLDK